MKTKINNARRLLPCWLRVTCMMILSLLGIEACAQTATFGSPGVIGSPTSNCGPVTRTSASSTEDFSQHYYLYTAADMAAAGIVPGSTITGIGWYKANNGATSSGNLSSIWKIHMKNTATLPSPTWCNPSYAVQSAGATLVYNNPAQVIPNTIGWINLTLTTPFVYTGGSLEIGSNWNCSLFTGNPTTNAIVWNQFAVPNINQTFGARGSSSSLLMINESCSPISQLVFTTPAPCTSVSSIGNTISSVSSACPNAPFNLTLQFPPPSASGLTYLWERSDDSSFTTNVTTLGTGSVQSTSATTPSYYRCTVTCTSGGSTSVSSPVFVDVYDPVLAYAAGLDLHCHGDNLGEVYLSVSGGNGTYTFNWNNGFYNSQNISNLSAGTYSVLVIDGNGCSASASAIVNEPLTLTATTLVTNVSASGMSDGSITVNALGGTPPYQYSIDGGITYVPSNLFTGLAATMYIIRIQDAANCVTLLNVAVNNPGIVLTDPGISINVTDDQDTIAHIVWGVPTSFPAFSYTLERSDDSINFVPVSFITTPQLVDIMTLPPTSVNAFGSILFTTEMQPHLIFNEVVQNLTPNTKRYYRVRITNQSQTLVVYTLVKQFLPPPVANQPWPILNPTPCPPIGIPPLGYTPTNWTSSQQIGCCLVTKRLYVKYGCANPMPCRDCLPACTCTTDPCCIHNCANYLMCGCTPWNSCGTTTQYVWVVIGSVYLAPVITTTQTNVTCNGGSNGSITIAGGVSPCKRNKIIGAPACFASTHPMPFPNALGQTSNVFTGLCAGCYTIMVTDCNGCTATKVVCITQPTPINLTATVVNSCTCTGSITVTATGGTPCLAGYTYQKLPSGLPQTSNTFTNLCQGCYTIKVTDCNGCTKTIVKCVVSPTPITATASVTNVSCYGGNNGTIIITSSVPSLCVGYSIGSSCTATGPIVASPVFTGLPAGTYCIHVRNLCTNCDVCICVTVTQPSPITLSATSVNTCSCNGSITVTATGGTPCTTAGGGYTYQLLPAGLPQPSNTFNGLCPGCYTIKVTDCNGCTATIVKCITAAGSPIGLNAIVTNVSCFGGSNGTICITNIAGVVNPCLKYAMVTPNCQLIASSVFTTNPCFAGLVAGNYCIKIKDTCTGCDTCICVTLIQPSPIIIIPTGINACPGVNNGTATVNVSGGSMPYTFSWSNGQTTPSIIGLAPGTYTVVVADLNGCGASATQVIGVSACNPVTVNLQLFIQGYYLSGNMMTPALFNQSLITSSGIADEITVELHSATAPYGLVASNIAFLHTNGMVSCTFNTAGPGLYYIAVRHKNSVQTWSANPIQLSTVPALYNFTNAASKAYGDNMTEVEPGVWAFYSGDITQDENIDLNDLSVFENDATNFLYGYLATDVNGDGSVDLLDSPIVENNINFFIFSIHP